MTDRTAPLHPLDAAEAADLRAGWVVPLGERGEDYARVDEALGCLADGAIGTRASLEEGGPATRELVCANGVLTPGAAPRVLAGPIWTRVPVLSGDPRRSLHLRTGTLRRRGADVDGVRFSSLARPGLVGLRLSGRWSSPSPGPLVAPTETGLSVTHGVEGTAHWMATSMAGIGLVAAASDIERPSSWGRTLERMAVYGRFDGDLDTARAAVIDRLDVARSIGFDALLAEHETAWDDRWREVDVEVEGDTVSQRGLRFALFHLLATVPEHGEASVGARGLSGTAYDGHVFWDADVFVLPAIAPLRPAASRAMLDYRLARLPAARAEAAGSGDVGARFPWESATTGRDVTPRTGTDLEGREVPVLTGEHAVHITADVAWAAAHHVAWTADPVLHDPPGRDVLLDTARFWAGRIAVDEDGRGHLRGVVGPDEYHGPVDDDVYTNALARWNLRVAADHAHRYGGARAEEIASWRRLAEAVALRYDPVNRRHEQFDGAARLEPLLISELVDTPVAADVLLGPERTAASQVLKQPDVLMAHHLIPDELPPGSLRADLEHEGPRIAHGSSLSLPIYAAMLARAGRPDDALEAFRSAARLDLDDLTGTTAAGLHLACMGGLLQALVWGFAGVRPSGDGLTFAPCIPATWQRVRFSVRYRGIAVAFDLTPERGTAIAERPLIWHLRDGPPRSSARVVTAPAGPRTTACRDRR